MRSPPGRPRTRPRADSRCACRPRRRGHRSSAVCAPTACGSRATTDGGAGPTRSSAPARTRSCPDRMAIWWRTTTACSSVTTATTTWREEGAAVPTRATQTPRGSTGQAPTLTWSRLRRPAAAVALGIAVTAAVLESLGAVIAGQIAGPFAAVTWGLVGLLAFTLIGSAVCDTIARTLASGVVAHAEGQLRADLLQTALGQSLPALQEQAV